MQLLCERRLDVGEFVAVILDGKTFAQDVMVIALGLTLQGQKQILGFVQIATENEPVCAAFLRALVERGLGVEPGLLCVSLIEPRLRQIKGHRHLPQLRAALQAKIGKAERVEGTHNA